MTDGHGEWEPKQFRPMSALVRSINVDGREATISDAFNNGMAQTVRVELESGTAVTCTPNHKLVVLNSEYGLEWKPAGELQEGDWVVGRKGLNLWQSDTDALSEMVGSTFEYAQLTNSKDVKRIRRMSTGLARLLGYLCSDGGVGPNGIFLSQTENNVGPDFVATVSDLFGVDVRYSPDHRSPGLGAYVANSRELAAFFRWLGITGHDDIRVPLAIRRSGWGCVKEFIRGATLDGYVSEKVVCVATSVSKRYLQDLRELLLNGGIEGRVVQTALAGERLFPCGRTYKTKDGYALILTDSREAEKFVAEVGFAEDRKNQEAKQKYRTRPRKKVKGDAPDFGLRVGFRTSTLGRIRSNSLYEKMHSVCAPSKYGMSLSRESLMEMADFGFPVPAILMDDTYTLSRVASVTDAGLRQTFDVTVPDANSYIVNGFVSHNTVNLPSDVTVEQVAEIYETAWKSGCKGITVYRDGCRDGVLLAPPPAQPEPGAAPAPAGPGPVRAPEGAEPPRPVEVPCECHRVNVSGTSYFVLVGLIDGAPYEVFAGPVQPGDDELPDAAVLRKVKRGKYQLHAAGEVLMANVAGRLSDEQDAVTRLASFALRHGARVAQVVAQLEKVGGAMTGFAKAMARALKKYVPDGTAVAGARCEKCDREALERQEGCTTCRLCGWSKCA
jgi:ribonucleoside-diphosphate reductase alpha chain